MKCLHLERVLGSKIEDKIESIRKSIGLNTPEEVEEAVDLLDSWIKKQSHFKKKDFSRRYLESIIIASKGSVERAKGQIDKLCAFKTLMPRFFKIVDARAQWRAIDGIGNYALLPNLSEDFYRIFLMKIDTSGLEINHLYSELFGIIFAMLEFVRVHDFSKGFFVVLDLTEFNCIDFFSKVNMTEFRQGVNILKDGYGTRIKGIHVIVTSKVVDILFSIGKQILNTNMVNRFHIHQNIELLHDFIPKDLLPIDYGGKLKTLKEHKDDWVDALSTEEFKAHLSELNAAGTDESLRQTGTLNELYMGIPGTFRTLSVD